MTEPAAEVVSSRRTIDEIDHALVELLARRRAVVKDLFAKKRVLGLPLIDPLREAALLEVRRGQAQSLGVPAEFVEDIFRRILEDSHGLDVAE
ncbi:MAG TPA: chorismate mutase [Polyangium sp.]|nr:chorismate mutase [Polyangium sp.]